MVTLGRAVAVTLFVTITTLVGLGIESAQAHETNVHREITDRAIEYLKSKRPEMKACDLPIVRDNLKQGVTDEDALVFPPLGNFLFHFYPLLNDTFTSSSFGTPISVKSTCSSTDWGFSPPPPNIYCFASTSVVPYPGQFNNDKYDLMLQLLGLRGTSKSDGLVSLGHFLHLLQDLTSPAHTRNDAHPHTGSFFVPLFVPPFGLLFVEASELGDPSKFEVLNGQRVEDGLHILPLPTDDLLDFSDPQSAFTQLASQTASGFYSEKNTNAPSDPSVLPGPSGTLGSDGYVRDASGKKIAYAYPLPLLRPDSDRYTIDDIIAEEQFAQLGPIAVRWTASMINFIHTKGGSDGKGIPVCEEQLVVKAVGNGTVTSSPAGISCGSTCEYYFPAGKTITLTALPGSGATFLGWSGEGCSGTGTCVVKMDDDKAKNVTATFSTPVLGRFRDNELNFELFLLTDSTGNVTGEQLLPPNLFGCQVGGTKSGSELSLTGCFDSALFVVVNGNLSSDGTTISGQLKFPTNGFTANFTAIKQCQVGC